MKSPRMVLRWTSAVALGAALSLSGVATAGADGRAVHDHHRPADGARAPEVRHYEGVISALSLTGVPPSVTITTHAGVSFAFALTGTQVLLGRTASTTAALAINEKVSVTPTPTSTPGALTAATIVIKAPEQHYEGVVSAVPAAVPGTLSITTHSGTTVSFTVTSATMVNLGRTASTTASLAPNEHVAVTVTPTSTLGALTAATIVIKAPEQHYEGVVSAVPAAVPGTLSITTHSGTTVSFTVTPTTTVNVGRTPATAGSLAIGQKLSITIVPTSTPGALTAATIVIKAPEVRHYEGVVTGWSGVASPTSLSIVNGRTTVTFALGVGASATTFTMGGASTTSASLADGERVSVSPTPTSTVGALTAASVVIKSPDSLHVRGLVKSLTATELQVSVGANIFTFGVTPTTLFLQAGQPVPSTTIGVNQRVALRLGTTPAGGMLPVLSVMVAPASN